MKFWKTFRTTSSFWLWIYLGILWIHSFSIGLSDDEAYYYVLSKKLQWGYAFHPPLVAWLIAFSKTVGSFIGIGSLTFWVRFPALVIVALLILLLSQWFDRAHRFEKSSQSSRQLAMGSLLGLVGIWGSVWMTVPDLPLILGWLLLFIGTSEFEVEIKCSRRFIFWGSLILLLSKYTGILAIASAFIWILIRRKNTAHAPQAFFALLMGSLLAFLPMLYWSWQTNFESILFHLKGRHDGGSFEWMKGFRFWVLQIFLTGGLIFWTVKRILHFSRTDLVLKHALIYSFPPLVVFGLQPFFSPFKFHWILIAWLPFSITLARNVWTQKSALWAKFQMVYAIIILGLLAFMLHLPWTETYQQWIGREVSPQTDISNDFRGWNVFSRWYLSLPKSQQYPLVASRYQTASQAQASLDERSDGEDLRVQLLPRDRIQNAEWSQADRVVENALSGSLKLLQTVYHVRDSRYTQRIQFTNAICEEHEELHIWNGNQEVKQITVDLCQLSSGL